MAEVIPPRDFFEIAAAPTQDVLYTGHSIPVVHVSGNSGQSPLISFRIC
jgi:hypothetical protein